MFYGMLGVVLGGRIGYMLFYDFDSFLADPLMLFKVWEGGMSFHGGLLGVLVAVAVVVARKHGCTSSTPSISSRRWCRGAGLRPLGNFIGGELWGKYTRAGRLGRGVPRTAAICTAWAAPLKAQHASGHARPVRAPSLAAVPVHARRAGDVRCVLWWFSRKPRPRYAVSGLFALLYGCFRFLVEFVRVPDDADRLSRLRLVDHGPGAEPAADRCWACSCCGCRAARRHCSPQPHRTPEVRA
jgi:phosphatidylglycerol:prolipoprotein diacylglycerol transferase